MRVRCGLAILLAGLLSAACTPTVQLAMPNEPININLNVKIEHEILIKVDKELDAMFSDSSGLF
ncbi:MAG: YnbE family lipoprotein [Gammaproteobacteria bacterium]|nr:YnbE family lipoprotein [Gammaproteobacteria bacterium]